ncbi:S1 family peptidase [Actinomadura kijaniata]|uniref:S1 family peptidase n=1 Tax=Actinomadura kijaniata TaxID=46161 RepID=UPI00082F75AF|nr:S1 family peptidase [Actinomadura kijaniata]
MRLGVAMTLLVAVAAPVSAAGSAPAGPENARAIPAVVTVKPAQSRTERVSPAELEDLRLVARSDGISLEEAVRRWGWQGSFLKVTGRLQGRYPGEYSGAEIIGEGSGAWIGFKGAVPPEAVVLARTLPVPVRLIGNKGFSEKELNDATVENFFRVAGHPGVETAEGGYEIASGVIGISVAPRGHLSANERRRLLRGRAEAPITVSVTIVDRVDASPKAHMHGGGFLNGDGICTAAFTVRKGRARGVATAHHCSQGNSRFRFYNHHHRGRFTTIKRRGSHGGRYGDMAWYSSGRYKAVPWFYYAPNKRRKVHLYRWPRVGQKICNYGRFTHTKCTKVYKNGQCVKYAGLPRYCGLTAVRGEVTRKGDSGGPWYWGNDAYGILSGAKRIDRRTRDLFTPVAGMYEAMGVSVYLS